MPEALMERPPGKPDAATENTEEACRFVRERIEADLKFSQTREGRIQ